MSKGHAKQASGANLSSQIRETEISKKGAAIYIARVELSESTRRRLTTEAESIQGSGSIDSADANEKEPATTNGRNDRLASAGG